MTEEEPLEPVDVVRMSVEACRRNQGGRRVVLYVDESMLAGNGTDFLPVMSVEGEGGYYNFIEGYRDEIAAWFGPSYPEANARVAQVNAENGIGHDEALRIIGDAMFNNPF